MRRISEELNLVLRTQPETRATQPKEPLSSDPALARALRAQLRVSSSDWNTTTEEMLLDMVEPLERLLREGPPEGRDRRGEELASLLTQGLKLQELVETFRGLGWDDQTVDGVEIDQLRTHLHTEFTRQLGEAVSGMLEQWKVNGAYELVGKGIGQRPDPGKLRRSRRDSLKQPPYRPPGRS